MSSKSSSRAFICASNHHWLPFTPYVCQHLASYYLGVRIKVIRHTILKNSDSLSELTVTVGSDDYNLLSSKDSILYWRPLTQKEQDKEPKL